MIRVFVTSPWRLDGTGPSLSGLLGARSKFLPAIFPIYLATCPVRIELPFFISLVTRSSQPTGDSRAALLSASLRPRRALCRGRVARFKRGKKNGAVSTAWKFFSQRNNARRNNTVPRRFRDLNGPEIHGLSANARFLFVRGRHTLSRAPSFSRALDPRQRFAYFPLAIIPTKTAMT